MNVDAPRPVRPLRRVIRDMTSVWRTRDERFEIVADPNGYPELGIGGIARPPRRAWFVYPTAKVPKADVNLPVFVHGNRAWATLRDATDALERATLVDVEPIE